MGNTLFYHLTRSPVETLLPMLLDKALAAGWQVAVRGTDAERMRWLDERLWLGPEDRFLPHGLAGGAHDAAQPVLLTTESESPNGAACLVAIDGAAVSAQEALALERVCILFDGADAAAVAHARDQWSVLAEAGVALQYWSEAGGRWRKERG
jgi:DNA polymerase III subunit chi